MEFIKTDNALAPAGHYSQAVLHNGILYVSGQLSINPDTGEKQHGTAGTEAKRILENIELILEKAGTKKRKCT